MINKETIRQRKRVYGSNFKDIAFEWANYLEINLTEQNVAYMMMLMKEVRIEHINKKIEELQYALKDSETDYDNYNWIAVNFKEYEEL